MESTSKDQKRKVYNLRALLKCEASYLGAAIPTLTTQPPGVINEPLETICKGQHLPTTSQLPAKPVRLHVFHSAIIIELLFGRHAGELVWYPIQNLFCSAALLPCMTENGNYEFKTLGETIDPIQKLKPVFALVLRETVQKKVLQCHAFSVVNKELAKLLVQATALAFREKEGWNQPLMIEQFTHTNYRYSLNGIDMTTNGISNENHVTQVDILTNGYTDLNKNYTGSKLQYHEDVSKPKTRSKDVNSKNRSKAQHNHHSQTDTSTDELLSPSSAGSSSCYSGFRTDLPINIPQTKTSLSKSTSLSSGYALSNSSSATYHQHSPQVVVAQKNISQHADKARLNGHSNHTHNHSEPPIETLEQMTIKQKVSPKKSSENHKSKSKKSHRKDKSSSEDDGRYRRFFIDEADGMAYLSQYPDGDLVPVFHPEQFMYGDTYSIPSPGLHYSHTSTLSSLGGNKTISNDRHQNQTMTNHPGNASSSGYTITRVDNPKKKKKLKERQLL